MMRRTPDNKRRGRRPAGFSMLEVLFALMILGVGLIAVASILPVAGILQRETVDEVHSQQVAESIKSQVEARGFSRAQLEQAFGPLVSETNFDVRPMPERVLAGADDDPLDNPSGIDAINWTLQDRVFPAVLPDVLNQPADEFFQHRHYYWVPLVQRREDGSWRVFVFLLRNELTDSYFLEGNNPDPQVDLANPHDDLYFGDELNFRTPIVRWYDGIDHRATGGTVIRFEPADDRRFIPSVDLNIGTQFLDNHGTIHTVVAISGNDVIVSAPIQQNKEPDYIWYGVPSENGRVPTRKVLMFGSEVIR